MNDNHDKPLFINFSNHPISGWSEEQLKAARHYGEVFDLPFPQVDPMATSQEIQRLEEDCVCRILAAGAGHPFTVHVMGELTLVYHVVTALKQRGIPCVASTTDRDSTEYDGLKLSEFNFVRFREY